MLTMIFACDLNGVIGREGELPWHQSSDLQHFKRITMGKTVVMGRKTWEAIGRPLPNRRNIVMTRSGPIEGAEVMSFDDVLALSRAEEVMIIGGGEIYSLFLEHAKEVHRTIIHAEVIGGDAFAPDIGEAGFYLIAEQHLQPGERDDHPMTFQHWIV